MRQIAFNLPEDLVADLDEAARRVHITRDDLLCWALEDFLDDHEDERIAVGRLEDRSDAVLDWNLVRPNLA